MDQSISVGGACMGAFMGFLILCFFGPVYTVAGVIVGTIIGGMIDFYCHRLAAWRASEPEYGHRPPAKLDIEKLGGNGLKALVPLAVVGHLVTLIVEL